MTQKQKEQKLNRIYSEVYNEDDAVESLIYLTSKKRGRGNYTTEANIRKQYRNRKLGTLLRRLDPIAFNVD